MKKIVKKLQIILDCITNKSNTKTLAAI